MYFLGYDVGSSSVKATLLESATNKAVASAQYPKTEMSMIAKQSGWAEQNPDDWWEAIKQTTQEIKSKFKVDTKEIKSIGISYQMHGLVIVDKNLKALRPSIIWCDSRAVEIGDRAYKKIGPDYCSKSLLNSPGNFTASKLAWVAQNEPKIYNDIYKAMLPGDYIAMKLSGHPQTTFSGLSEGIFYDFTKDTISEEVLEHYKINAELLPDIVPTFGEQEEVSSTAAREIGLSPGTKITYRAGDQPNNALSLNVLEPGELAATAGTSGVVYGITDQLNNDAASRVNAFAHVNHTKDKRRLGILLCINGTGILNAWGRKNMGNLSYDQMNDLARTTPIGSDGLTVLPFGNGAERILKNKNISAQISGLQFNIHSNAHVFRAIQEGIACSLRYGTDIMKSMKLNPSVIRAGKANLFLSPIFQKAVANLTNATIELYDTDGAQGAARGAGIGIGYYDQKSAFDGLNLLKKIEPSPKEKGAYEKLYEVWSQNLMNALSNS